MSTYPSTRRRGFTLIELMIVVAIIAIIAAIAIPGLIRARISANESSAMGTLRSLATAQTQFKNQGLLDQDGDGVGEYAWFGELCGTEALRNGVPRLAASPFVSSSLGVKDLSGHASKSGYFYKMYLPTGTATAVAEPTVVPAAMVAADANVQETLWCCYAWPNTRGTTGNRAFVVNQSGTVLATSNNTMRYSGSGGTGVVPVANAVFETGTGNNLESALALAAAGGTANDGEVWVPAGN